MKRLATYGAVFAIAAVVGFGLLVGAAETSDAPAWKMNATIIEACSCPMFCQCYFNTKPAVHTEGHGHHGGEGGTHFCKFNMGFKVNKGHHGDTKLDGAKFWITGDLGADYSEGKMDWAILTFDKALSEAQRAALLTIVPKVYPAEWASFTTSEGSVSWEASVTKAHALLDGGKTAEVLLEAPPTAMASGKPMVLDNLKYWGAPRNDGFVLMPNVVEAYRVGDKAFEYKGTNGFMITLEIDSESVASSGM